MAEIKSLLDEVIEKEIVNLDSLPIGDEKKAQAIKDLVQLHKLRIEEIKAQTEADEKRERREMDSKKNEADLALKEKQAQAQEAQQQTQAEHGDRELALKEREIDGKDADRTREEEATRQQVRENRIDRYVRTGVAVAELVLPLAFYGVWMGHGFEFEKTGSFTSTTFKNLLNRFRPTK